MKVKVLHTIKYGSGKYIDIGTVIDLDDPALHKDIHRAIEGFVNNPSIVRTIGVPHKAVSVDELAAETKTAEKVDVSPEKEPDPTPIRKADPTSPRQLHRR